MSSTETLGTCKVLCVKLHVAVYVCIKSLHTYTITPTRPLRTHLSCSFTSPCSHGNAELRWSQYLRPWKPQQTGSAGWDKRLTPKQQQRRRSDKIPVVLHLCSENTCQVIHNLLLYEKITLISLYDSHMMCLYVNNELILTLLCLIVCWYKVIVGLYHYTFYLITCNEWII